MNIVDLNATYELMKSVDPTLQIEFVHLPHSVEGKCRDYWLVRDTTRWSSQTWSIGSMRLVDQQPLTERMTLGHCRAIKSYFDGARARHPESYKTCACHAHHPSRQNLGASQ